MIDVENRHLVAVDNGSPAPGVVVCMPPSSISKDEALTFASHLVAKANAALFEKGLPISTPRTLFDAIDKRTKTPPNGIKLSPDGRVLIASNIQFLSAADAIDVAACLVSIADPSANMLERVSAVVDAARGGAALTRELNDPRTAKINLSEPRKVARLVVDDVPEAIVLPPLNIVEDRTPEQLEEDGDSEAAQLRRMKGGA